MTQKEKIYNYFRYAVTASKYNAFKWFEGEIAPETIGRRLRELVHDKDKKLYSIDVKNGIYSINNPKEQKKEHEYDNLGQGRLI